MNKCWYFFCIVGFFSIGDGQTAEVKLSLDAAIEMGLKNNPEIKSSIEKINASWGKILNAVSPASPDVSITNDYIPAGQNLGKYGEKTIGVSQTVDFPTNYFLRGSKNVKEKQIAENELVLVKLGVISKVKKAYFNVLALEKQIGIAQENLSITQDFVKKAEIRYLVGEGTNLEKLTAEVSATEALNAIEIQKNRYVAAVAELNYAMGYGKGHNIQYQLVDTLSFYPLEMTISQFLDDASVTNPLVKLNQLRIDLCSNEKSLSWSSLLPSVNLGFFRKEVKSDPTGYYGASISFGIPLWFLLDHRGRIKEGASNVSSAEFDLLTAQNSLYAKTQSAYAEFKYEEKQVQLYLSNILPQAEEIFRTALKSYEAGEITYLEFLQAQQTLINSRAKCTDALLSYNCAIVTIEETIGRTIK